MIALTALLTGLQFVFPSLLPALKRTPAAIAGHEFWRLITPLFVHADGWRQIAFNFSGIAIVGMLAERIFGSARWLILYFVPGITAEVIALFWQPYGAGASIAGAGLLGALAAWLLLAGRRAQAWIRASFILMGAIVLTFFRDIHGPPLLLGAGIAALMIRKLGDHY
ncbi:MAG: rhomboid family intramembrane serine protease [Candidatus Angelobacter sp.]